MPSFNIFGSSSTAQSLATGEEGFIGQNGALAVTSIAPISVAGSIDLVILGSVTALDSGAIVGAVSSADIIIGSTGQVVSGSGDAIDISTAGTLTVTNDGFISSSMFGLDLGTTDGAASINIRNSGVISTVFACIDTAVGTGTVRVANSGTMMTTSGSVALNFSAGSVFVENTGTIIGDIHSVSGSVRMNIVNTGTIQGNIEMQGPGSVDTRGGIITGTIVGYSGDHTFRIDQADMDISDFGSTGFDTILTSVTYEIGLGIERLALTGSGNISAFGSGRADVLDGNTGNNVLTGRRGSDTLQGGNGNDTLFGGSGDDNLRFDSGDDVIDGGSGIDTLNFQSASFSLVVNLAAGTVSGEDADSDTVSGIENVLSGSGADTITGSDLANVIRAGQGHDSVRGGGGNDTIAGEFGTDTMTGGSGDDTFLFDLSDASFPTAPDVITDFRPGRDVIDVSALDADPAGAVEAFVFNGVNFLPQGIGSIRAFQDLPNNRTVVEIRDSLDLNVDLRIYLTGLLTLTAGDFVL